MKSARWILPAVLAAGVMMLALTLSAGSYAADAGEVASEVADEVDRPVLRFGVETSFTGYDVDQSTPFGPILAGVFTGSRELLLKLEEEGVVGEGAGTSYRLEIEGSQRDHAITVRELSVAGLTRAGLVEGGLREISQGKGFSVNPNCPFEDEVSYYFLQATGSPVDGWTLLARYAAKEMSMPPIYMLQLSRSLTAGDLELDLSGGPDLPLRIGGGWSGDLGQGWQAYADVALRRPDEGMAYPAAIEGEQVDWLPASDASEYRPEALAGVQYTSEQGIVTTAEIFHSGLGCNAAQREHFWQVAQTPWGAGEALAAMKGLRLGQNYATLALTHSAALGGAGWEVSVWVNLDDGSKVWRGEYSGPGDTVVPVVEVERFSGSAASEYGSQARTMVKAGLEAYF